MFIKNMCVYILSLIWIIHLIILFVLDIQDRHSDLSNPQHF